MLINDILLCFGGAIFVLALFLWQTRKSKLDATQKEIERLREERERSNGPRPE
jgi:hypothetical protein